MNIGKKNSMRDKTEMVRLAGCLILCLALSHISHGSTQAKADWPMLAHDVARTGATSTEVRPPFERKWYRIFPDEGLMAGIQPVIADGKVFIGTMAAEVFAVRALILREPAEKLTRFLDIPWCKADLFYTQKLVFTIEAHGRITWKDVRKLSV